MRGSPIEITKAGGFFKARFRGCANFTLGSTAGEAKDRLLNSGHFSLRNSERQARMTAHNQWSGFKA